MWEESVPKPAPTGKTRPKREENLVLYAQILLAAAAIAAALNAGTMTAEAGRFRPDDALTSAEFDAMTQRQFSREAHAVEPLTHGAVIKALAELA